MLQRTRSEISFLVVFSHRGRVVHVTTALALAYTLRVFGESLVVGLVRFYLIRGNV